MSSPIAECCKNEAEAHKVPSEKSSSHPPRGELRYRSIPSTLSRVDQCSHHSMHILQSCDAKNKNPTILHLSNGANGGLVCFLPSHPHHARALLWALHELRKSS